MDLEEKREHFPLLYGEKNVFFLKKEINKTFMYIEEKRVLLNFRKED
jgi:hypothetical protein